MNNSVIYTSIFGGYDRLRDPVVHSASIDYICFTNDSKMSSDVWQIRVLDPHFPKDMTRSARLPKICPHRFLGEYDYSLYIDGNMLLNVIPDVLALLEGKTIAIERHPKKRNCIYAEADACKKSHRGNPKEIDKQTDIYRNMGVPKNVGLYVTWMIVRKHNDERLSILSEIWWEHLCSYSVRDQISFPVVFKDYPIASIPKSIRDEMVTRPTKAKHIARRNRY